MKHYVCSTRRGTTQRLVLLCQTFTDTHGKLGFVLWRLALPRIGLGKTGPGPSERPTRPASIHSAFAQKKARVVLHAEGSGFPRFDKLFCVWGRRNA